MPAPDPSQVKLFLLDLQQRICQQLEAVEETTSFATDQWSREKGAGGGICRVLSNGAVFERAGVNFSHVSGSNMPISATAHRPELEGCDFEAMGVSLVIHPKNPYVPTTHANVRFFIATKPNAPAVWWFGGGFDLTPYYPFLQDIQQWHLQAKAICDPFGQQLYPKYKKWCDDYFYLPHRDETRGVGGIFFDDLNTPNFESSFEFMQAVGNGLINNYIPIVKRRMNTEYGERERQFQCYRRGRYVEFNLVYDRGTLFGLQTGGRTESILMSMPPHASWEYDYTPKPNSPEAVLYDHCLKPQDWLTKKDLKK